MKNELRELVGTLGGEKKVFVILTKYIEKRKKSLERRAVRKIEMQAFKDWKESQTG